MAASSEDKDSHSAKTRSYLAQGDLQFSDMLPSRSEVFVVMYVTHMTKITAVQMNVLFKMLEL